MTATSSNVPSIGVKDEISSVDSMKIQVREIVSSRHVIESEELRLRDSMTTDELRDFQKAKCESLMHEFDAGLEAIRTMPENESFVLAIDGPSYLHAINITSPPDHLKDRFVRVLIPSYDETKQADLFARIRFALGDRISIDDSVQLKTDSTYLIPSRPSEVCPSHERFVSDYFLKMFTLFPILVSFKEMDRATPLSDDDRCCDDRPLTASNPIGYTAKYTIHFHWNI